MVSQKLQHKSKSGTRQKGKNAVTRTTANVQDTQKSKNYQDI